MNLSTQPNQYALRRSPASPLDRILRSLVGLILLALAGFCGFGFLASFEVPGPPGLPWKIGYAVAGIVLATGAAVQFRGAISAGSNRRHDTTEASAP